LAEQETSTWDTEGVALLEGRGIPVQCGNGQKQRAGECVIHRYVFHNEELKAIDKVRWSPGQAGLICGWGVFTTLRIVRGEAFAYERHWRRLEKDSVTTRMPLSCTGARVRVQLQELIRANKVEEGCARIYLVWNTVGFWKSDEKMPDVDLMITTADLPHYPDTVRLTVREQGRHAASPLAGVKTISWLNSVWAVAEAQREGFDEVVLLNERGEVSECTAANIFAVKGDKVLTPPLSSGCLEGVTRGVLTEVAAEAGATVVEQTLRMDDLYNADEVFITSTNRNVIGVREIAGRTIGSGGLGAVTKRLDTAFESFVKDYVERRLAASH
jgi:branched-chain amino acid aminotransferase